MLKQERLGRNPFQGGMGFFTRLGCLGPEKNLRLCRNPFQGGMGFFTYLDKNRHVVIVTGRNPFQGGMGFFTGPGPGTCLELLC